MRLLSLLSLLAVAPAAPAQIVAVVGSNNQFGYFDLSSPTNSYRQITGTISNVTRVRNIASDGTDLYVTDNMSNGTYLLKTLDFSGTASSAIGTILDQGSNVSLRGFTFDAGGTLYAYNGNGQRLLTIDPDDAATARLTSASGVSVAVGVLPDRLAAVGGVLYGTLDTGTSDGLYTFDKTTGVATFKGAGPAGNPTRDAATYTSMLAFSNGSTLYGISGTTLYEVSMTDGSLTTLATIGGLNVPSSFLAAVIAPVPEPAAVLGVSALGLGLARWVRRRAVRAATDADSFVAG